MRLAPSAFDVTRFEASLSAGRDAFASGRHGGGRGQPGVGRGRVARRRSRGRSAYAAARRCCHTAIRNELDAFEEKMEAELALRRHRALIPQLEALVAEAPYREQFCAQLVLAISASFAKRARLSRESSASSPVRPLGLCIRVANDLPL